MVSENVIMDVLKKMQEYFGKKLTPDIISLYVEHLEKFNEEKFKAASVRLMLEFQQTSTTPFPLIRDFLVMCGEDSKTKAVNIVTAVKKAAEALGQYESVTFGDPALHSVIRRYGGWPTVVLWGEKDWQLHERNFIAAYEGAVKAKLQEGYCKGLCEIENGLNGFPSPAPFLVDKNTGRIMQAPDKVKEPRELITERTKNDGTGSIRGILAGNNVYAA
jgi:hypothetical protein